MAFSKGIFYKNPNVIFLQEQFGLTAKDARKVDSLIRAYISQGDCGDTDVSEAIIRIIQEYPINISAEEMAERSITAATHYFQKDDDWLWNESIFCIVAYFYTVLCLLIDTVEVLDWLNILPDNPSFETKIIVVLQFLITMTAVGLGNQFVKKHRGDRKYKVWFTIANKYMPTITMIAYLVYYTVKLAFAQYNPTHGWVLFLVPGAYVTIGLAKVISTHRKYKKAIMQ